MISHRGRYIENVMLSEAVVKSAATETIGRRLGDELISQSREVITAFHQADHIRNRRLRNAIAALARLVGTP